VSAEGRRQQQQGVAVMVPPALSAPPGAGGARGGGGVGCDVTVRCFTQRGHVVLLLVLNGVSGVMEGTEE